MLLARYLHVKKPLHFTRRTYAKKRGETPPPLTLRPESLVTIRPPPLDLSNKVSHNVLGIDLHYVFSTRFPTGTRGFLYYQPGSTQLAGQLRLRICDDASSFDAGRDLLVNNRPWGFDLVNMVRRPRCQPLLDLLVQDGFVAPQTIAGLRARLTDTGIARAWRNVLCALSDPFYIQLDTPTHRLRIVSEQHIRDYRFSHAFSSMPQSKDHKYALSTCAPSSAPIPPFTGTLKVRFELSKFPEHASLGPTLVLKILETHNVQHVRKDVINVKEPIAGEYHYRILYTKMTLWRLCIDEVEDRGEAFGPLLNMPGIVYAE